MRPEQYCTTGKKRGGQSGLSSVQEKKPQQKVRQRARRPTYVSGRQLCQKVFRLYRDIRIKRCFSNDGRQSIDCDFDDLRAAN